MTAQYVSETTIRVEQDGEVKFIPTDPANSDYAALLASGEPIAPYVPPAPPVPQSVTPRQVRLLLLSQGLLSQVEALIAQQDEATKITWAYASEFRRDDPLLISLAQSLSLSDQQLDEFFIAAASL